MLGRNGPRAQDSESMTFITPFPPQSIGLTPTLSAMLILKGMLQWEVRLVP